MLGWIDLAVRKEGMVPQLLDMIGKTFYQGVPLERVVVLSGHQTSRGIPSPAFCNLFANSAVSLQVSRGTSFTQFRR